MTREARHDTEALGQIDQDTLNDIRGILTAEQRTEFDRWMAKEGGRKGGPGQGAERGRRAAGGRKAPGQPAQEEEP